ncbi:biotin--[acetyl-CoA-carboxylase] ligase [soil metagenome]
MAAATAHSRWTVEILAEAPSTNAAVAFRARSGADEGLVVVAEHQSSGRGRLDRTWVAPARSALTVSVLLTPSEVPVGRWPWLPLLAGVATAHAVRRSCGVDAALKWPNDVLVGGAKLAGILVERVVDGSAASAPAAVLGIGVNVSTLPGELPVRTATSLGLVSGAAVDRTALLLHLLDAIAEHYDPWRAAGGDPAGGLRAAYLSICDTVGREVRVELPSGGLVEGRAVGIDTDGRLRLETGSGAMVLGAGDVVHVRTHEPQSC